MILELTSYACIILAKSRMSRVRPWGHSGSGTNLYLCTEAFPYVAGRSLIWGVGRSAKGRGRRAIWSRWDVLRHTRGILAHVVQCFGNSLGGCDYFKGNLLTTVFPSILGLLLHSPSVQEAPLYFILGIILSLIHRGKSCETISWVIHKDATRYKYKVPWLNKPRINTMT